MSAVKRKYVPDLSRYMAQCEMNYALLLRCLRVAELSADGPVLPEIMSTNIEPLRIDILDEARYTTTLRLRLEVAQSRWVESIDMTVRLYHDAQMAEVIENQRNHAPRSNHAYPAQVKLYRDDKLQRNVLLQQCLGYCFSDSSEKVCRPILGTSGTEKSDERE
ncbi:MAG: DUF1249 domain-containing protein [Gammaproteobacteria bacterium]|nr:DUF1249 domain-containing protein [Gammaproteobacteria bacterium]NVK89096.1 DUF1249 domain-containing protein [Gammaproteobacteria bacterium]